MLMQTHRSNRRIRRKSVFFSHYTEIDVPNKEYLKTSLTMYMYDKRIFTDGFVKARGERAYTAYRCDTAHIRIDDVSLDM